MTSTEIFQAIALGRCTFSPGSTAKRFVRWAASIATSEPERAMSASASMMLNRLAHSYRAQLGSCMASDCTKCSPEEQQSLPVVGEPLFEDQPVRRPTADRFAAATTRYR